MAGKKGAFGRANALDPLATRSTLDSPRRRRSRSGCSSSVVRSSRSPMSALLGRQRPSPQRIRSRRSSSFSPRPNTSPQSQLSSSSQKHSYVLLSFTTFHVSPLPARAIMSDSGEISTRQTATGEGAQARGRGRGERKGGTGGQGVGGNGCRGVRERTRQGRIGLERTSRTRRNTKRTFPGVPPTRKAVIRSMQPLSRPEKGLPGPRVLDVGHWRRRGKGGAATGSGVLSSDE